MSSWLILKRPRQPGFARMAQAFTEEAMSLCYRAAARPPCSRAFIVAVGVLQAFG